MFHAGLYESDGRYGEDTHENTRLTQYWENNASLPKHWVEQKEDDRYFLNAEQALLYKVVDKILPNLNSSQ